MELTLLKLKILATSKNEELTLYIIQQEKQMENIEAETLLSKEIFPAEFQLI